MERSEQEVVISKCADEQSYTIYSTDPVHTRLFVRIAERVGGEVTKHQGGTKISIPKECLRFTVKRTIILSEDERLRRAEVFRNRLRQKDVCDI